MKSSKNSPIARAVALATCVGSLAASFVVADSASAQGAVTPQGAAATEGAIDTVVVTGIRAGIEDAIELKRESTSIVEAISAEDIGKLPDTSIADSISRLPGLTSQRAEGRASAVSN